MLRHFCALINFQQIKYQALKEILHLGVASKLLFCNYISLWCQSQSSRVFFFSAGSEIAVAEMMRCGAHAKRRFVSLSYLRIAAEAVGNDMSSTEL